jgi:DNA-binding MarR family transcriptional regulator
MPQGHHASHEPPLAILVMEAGAFVRDELRTTLAETGLRPRHCQLLMHLSEAGSTSQQDLLEALDLDASVLVGLLNDLEGNGFVQRLRDPADRRRHIVELSDRGGKELAKMDDKIAAIEGAVFAGVSVADRKVLRRALQSVWARGHSDGACS